MTDVIAQGIGTATWKIRPTGETQNLELVSIVSIGMNGKRVGEKEGERKEDDQKIIFDKAAVVIAERAE